MPIYEYNCTKCHKHFEIFQKMTNFQETVCPECGSKARRIMSQTSFTLKGGGWYKDGYTKKGAENSTPEKKPCDTCKVKEKCTEKK